MVSLEVHTQQHALDQESEECLLMTTCSKQPVSTVSLWRDYGHCYRLTLEAYVIAGILQNRAHQQQLTAKTVIMMPKVKAPYPIPSCCCPCDITVDCGGCVTTTTLGLVREKMFF